MIIGSNVTTQALQPREICLDGNSLHPSNITGNLHTDSAIADYHDSQAEIDDILEYLQDIFDPLNEIANRTKDILDTFR